MKKCSICKKEKTETEFHKNKRTSDGLARDCKPCAIARSSDHYQKHKDKFKVWHAANYKANKDKKNRQSRQYYTHNRNRMREYQTIYQKTHLPTFLARSKARKASKIKAIPNWADHELMKDFYEEAAYQSLQVDHIVPLKSPLVCGLHWEGNLQFLTRQQNISKGNRVWPDMP